MIAVCSMRGSRVHITGSLRYYYLLFILAIFYPFSQFCEIDVSLLSLQKQPNTAPILFQRGVEYGKYDVIMHSNSNNT